MAAVEPIGAPGGMPIAAQAVESSPAAASSGFPAEWTWRSVRSLLLSDSPVLGHLRLHVSAIRSQPALYAGLVRQMISEQVHLGWSTVGRARVLAAALSLKEKSLAIELLKTDGLMGLAEVLRAVQWLDSSRALRQLRAKVSALEAVGPAAVQRGEASAKKHDAALTKMRNMLTQLEADTQIDNDDVAYRTPARGKGRFARPAVPGGVGFSGNKARLIRKWAGAFPANTLSFFLLNFPKEPWRLLADLVHFKKEDFALPFFLACVYDAPPPEGSMVHLASTATRENLAALLEAERGLAACYSFFRSHFKDARTRAAEVDASVAEIMAMGFSRKAALLARQHHPARTPDAVMQCVEWILEHTLHIEASADPSAQNQQQDDLSQEAKAAFGRYAPLEDLLWYLEELDSPEVEAAIHARLTAGEQLNPASPRSNFGKLLERIILCRRKNSSFWRLLLPLADQRLHTMKQNKEKIAAGAALTIAPPDASKSAAGVDALASSLEAAKVTPAPAAAAADPLSLLADAAASPVAPDAAVVANATSSSSSIQPFTTAAARVPADGSKPMSARVAVLGDASGSMEIAIQSASSLGALLSAVLDAELSFFNSRSFQPPVQPRNATETLRVIDAVLASDNTSMAAALWPYFTDKKKVDLFVMVSDEGENAPAPNGMLFAQLWRAYREEVNPEAKLFLISFLPNDPSVVGTIKERLSAIGLGDDVPQFRFDINRPDTSKFDTVLGLLSLDIELIRQRQLEVKRELGDQHGIPNVLLDIVAEY